MIPEIPVRQYLAAVSCGIVEGTPLLDLDYSEDFHASTDLNCVMTEDGKLVELQATAEGAPYTRAELDSMLALAGAFGVSMSARRIAANRGVKEFAACVAPCKARCSRATLLWNSTSAIRSAGFIRS